MRTRTSSKITDAFIFWMKGEKCDRTGWNEDKCEETFATDSNKRHIIMISRVFVSEKEESESEPNWNHNIDQNKTSMIYFVLFSCCIISETPVRRICLVVSSQIGITKNRRVQQNGVFRVQNPEQNQQNRSVTAGGVVSDPSLCFCVTRCRDVTSWRAECDIKPAPVTNHR